MLATVEIRSKVPAKVEEFGLDDTDNQICTALLLSMTRACMQWHRSQFWMAAKAAGVEIL
jgi:hypothetical protein